MKISIVTACYNSESTIEDTIKSVLSQTHKDFEHIIVDGGSKDKTMDIVKKYKKQYGKKLKYISEKDKGIYDAMNKGIKMATGEVVGILNSDDVYASKQSLSIINKALEKDKYDGCYADLLYMDEKLEKPIRDWKTKTGKIKSGWMPAHPTFYIKKRVYDEVGLYNLKYKIVSDFDFMIKVCTNEKYHLKYINKCLIHMRLGGTSSDGVKGYIKNIKEAKQVLKDNGYKFSSIVIAKRFFITALQYTKANKMRKSKKR